MPAPRDRLCVYHAKGQADATGRADDDAGIGVRPPRYSALCSICRSEDEERLRAREMSGTRSQVSVSNDGALDDYLSIVKSPVARQMLTARRAADQLARDAEVEMLEAMDAQRERDIELDHAPTKRARIDIARRQHGRPRLLRPPGPRWYG